MTLQYSEINFDNNNNPDSKTLFNPPPMAKIKEKSTPHNKTAKKTQFDMSALYDKIHKKDKVDPIENPGGTFSNDSSDKLGDFQPLPPVEPVQMVKPTNYSLPHQSYEKINLQDKVNDYNETYYSSVPYSQMYNSNEKNKDLLNKLNYIISLLEEQKDEKTNNVIEEVILYVFLGIFIIFVIDSFAKASKYVR